MCKFGKSMQSWIELFDWSVGILNMYLTMQVSKCGVFFCFVFCLQRLTTSRSSLLWLSPWDKPLNASHSWLERVAAHAPSPQWTITCTSLLFTIHVMLHNMLHREDKPWLSLEIMRSFIKNINGCQWRDKLFLHFWLNFWWLLI